MIHAQVVLRCDQCRMAFHHMAETRNSERPDRSIGLIREKAHADGWRRYRATPSASMGDYCPLCQAAHETLKAGRKKK